MRTQDEEVEMYSLNEALVDCRPDAREALEQRRSEIIGGSVMYAVETWADFKDEIWPHWQRHYAERAHIALGPLAPDTAAYEKLFATNMLHAVIAREGGRIVGYMFFYTVPHLHMSTTPVAMGHLIWVDPDRRRRGIGAELIRRSWDHATGNLGVECFLAGGKHDDVGHALGGMLQRMGFEADETVYIKRVGR